MLPVHRLQMILPIILLCLLPSIESYRIAVFAPYNAGSQVIHYSRISTTLADAGHNVVLYTVAFSADPVPVKTVANDRMRIVKLNAYTSEMNDDWQEIKHKHAKVAFLEHSTFDPRQFAVFGQILSLFHRGCEVLVNDNSFLQQFSNEKFDLVITPAFDPCSIGIAHIANIPARIVSSSGPLLDNMASAAGAPMPPSYVPSPISPFSDVMTFPQRTISFITSFLAPFLFKRSVSDPETALFRKVIRPDFPDLFDLFKNSSLYFVNTHELYDFAHPTTHRIINIGGLGMTVMDSDQIKFDEPFKKIVEKHDKIVLFSLGSVTNSSHMPVSWKKALLSSFVKFPNYLFLLRYEARDLDNIIPKNVLLFKWLPQTFLLNHPHVRAFISHGGFNSLQESLFAGKPIITIPLYGDQFRNALIAEKHGFGYCLEKKHITEKKIITALHAVLEDPKYINAASRMRAMMKKVPNRAEELLVKFSEFAAEFKEFPNLVPYGTQLNFIQYYCIDVMLALGLIVLIALILLYHLIKNFCRLVKYLFHKTSSKKNKEE
ncbi:hypothetical protein AB6A40_003818 [Gnathostoma spinigerum]|uniref:glucuronosyltransferase n=1 Tax=Gnathostoma spinigerum TaxID=75299 RepID=A0ABD6EG57_9BILA